MPKHREYFFIFIWKFFLFLSKLLIKKNILKIARKITDLYSAINVDHIFDEKL